MTQEFDPVAFIQSLGFDKAQFDGRMWWVDPTIPRTSNYRYVFVDDDGTSNYYAIQHFTSPLQVFKVIAANHQNYGVVTHEARIKEKLTERLMSVINKELK